MPDAVTVRGRKVTTDEDSWDDATRADPPDVPFDDPLARALGNRAGVGSRGASNVPVNSAMGDAFEMTDDLDEQEEKTLNPASFGDPTLNEQTESSVKDRVPINAIGVDTTEQSVVTRPVGLGAVPFAQGEPLDEQMESTASSLLGRVAPRAPFEDVGSIAGGRALEWDSDTTQGTGVAQNEAARALRQTVAARPSELDKRGSAPRAAERVAATRQGSAPKDRAPAERAPFDSPQLATPASSRSSSSASAPPKSISGAHPKIDPRADTRPAPSGPFGIESTELDLDLWAVPAGAAPGLPFAHSLHGQTPLPVWGEEPKFDVQDPASVMPADNTAPSNLAPLGNMSAQRAPPAAEGASSGFTPPPTGELELEFETRPSGVFAASVPAALGPAIPPPLPQHRAAMRVEPVSPARLGDPEESQLHGRSPLRVERASPARLGDPEESQLHARSPMRVEPASPARLADPAEPPPLMPPAKLDPAATTYARFKNLKVAKTADSIAASFVARGRLRLPRPARDSAGGEEPEPARTKTRALIGLAVLLIAGALIGYAATLYFTGKPLPF